MGSVQRGATVARNDLGTLERPDGKGQYIGSVDVCGRVTTKKFVSREHDDADVERRWLEWQDRMTAKTPKKEESVDTKSKAPAKDRPWCPISGQDCTSGCVFKNVLGSCGLAQFAARVDMGKVDDLARCVESLEGRLAEVSDALATIALQGMDSEKAGEKPPARGGLYDWLYTKDARDFYNTTSRQNFDEASKWCRENGFAAPKSSAAVSNAIKEKFWEELSWESRGRKGTWFTYKKEA